MSGSPGVCRCVLDPRRGSRTYRTYRHTPQCDPVRRRAEGVTVTPSSPVTHATPCCRPSSAAGTAHPPAPAALLLPQPYCRRRRHLATAALLPPPPPSCHGSFTVAAVASSAASPQKLPPCRLRRPALSSAAARSLRHHCHVVRITSAALRHHRTPARRLGGSAVSPHADGAARAEGPLRLQRRSLPLLHADPLLQIMTWAVRCAQERAQPLRLPDNEVNDTILD